MGTVIRAEISEKNKKRRFAATPHPSFAKQMPPSPQGEGILKTPCSNEHGILFFILQTE